MTERQLSAGEETRALGLSFSGHAALNSVQQLCVSRFLYAGTVPDMDSNADSNGTQFLGIRGCPLTTGIVR
jgi:hypothetical protein